MTEPAASDATAFAHRERRYFVAIIAIVALIVACSDTPKQAQNAASRTVTFNRDVAPILFDNCASCHRPIDSEAPQVAAEDL